VIRSMRELRPVLVTLPLGKTVPMRRDHLRAIEGIRAKVSVERY
jgi:hypothetical protein